MSATSPQSDAAARTTGASLFSGSIWNSVAGLLPQFYTVAVSIAAARILGPDAFGRQSFIAFVSLSLALVLTAGLSIALMRSVAETLGREEPAQARGLLALGAAPAGAGGGGRRRQHGRGRARGRGARVGVGTRGRRARCSSSCTPCRARGCSGPSASATRRSSGSSRARSRCQR